uniref:protein MHF1 homolog n=1 Tax=Erigeron canadensis TaxID=72917 RepID=UPI001CB8EEDB|nr:protein MHF1 homolog [Erigeron canadensis]
MNPIEDSGYIGSEYDRAEEDEETTNHLRGRFRLSTISIAQSEAKQNSMAISQSVFVCVSDLAFKYAVTYAGDGSRQPSELELQQAFHQGKHIAAVAKKLKGSP